MREWDGAEGEGDPLLGEREEAGDQEAGGRVEGRGGWERTRGLSVLDTEGVSMREAGISALATPDIIWLQ